MYSLYILLNYILVLLCAAGPSLHKEPSESGCFQPAMTPEQRFEEFIEKYEKNYNEEEKEFRFQVFKEKLELIEQLNAEAGEEVHAIHSLSDLTAEEFSTMLGYRPGSGNMCEVKTEADVPNVEIPDRLDFRESGAVTPVKNQGLCGSCFAFSLTGAMESQYLMKHKQNLSFSVQQILDCEFTKKYFVCRNGGDSSEAATIMMEEYGGIELEADYPYENYLNIVPGECRFDRTKIRGKVASCQRWNVDEMSIKKVLYHYGPLAISVAYCENTTGACPGIPHGIFPRDSIYCKWQDINHSLLLVGYGTENGVPYWLIKNSWGTGWNEKGYYRIEAGVNCMQINSEVYSYQVV